MLKFVVYSIESLSAFRWPPVLKGFTVEVPVLTGMLENANGMNWHATK